MTSAFESVAMRRVEPNSLRWSGPSLEHSLGGAATAADVSAVLDELATIGKGVELVIPTRPMLLDPNDEMVLETAINGRSAIVTFNDRDFRSVAAPFRCSVMRPAEVIV